MAHLVEGWERVGEEENEERKWFCERGRELAKEMQGK